MDDAAASNRRGNALRQLGQREDALVTYDHALSLDPGYVAALYNRGNVLLELQRPGDAVASFEQVLAKDPADAEALTARGNALMDLRRWDEALDGYQRALSLSPQSVEALYGRGNALLELGRADDAVASYDRALSLSPDLAAALNNRGKALLWSKRNDDALASYSRSVVIQPDDALGHTGCGNALQALGRHQEAIASYDRALLVDCNNVEALNNRGNALRGLKRLDQALASYERALALAPESAGTLTNRGSALLELGRHDDALASYDCALAIDPGFVDALSNRGNALHKMGRYHDAASSFAQLVVLAPDYDYALGTLLDCRLRDCDWEDAPTLIREIGDGVRRGDQVVSPFSLLAMSSSAALQLQCAQAYAGNEYPSSASPLWTGEIYRHERIRIAYLSADFREHPVAQLAVGLFEAHDRRRFETVAVGFGPETNDPMHQRIRRSFERFLDVRRNSDREVAQMLRDQEIDIAVDLTGYTTDCRPGILAHRPAPAQVSFLGFPGTMGSASIDYIVADRFVIPSDHEIHYAEKVVRLPDSFQPNDSTRRVAQQTPSRLEAGLPQQGFVFCSFNNGYKLSPTVFDVWMRLLQQVEGSVLWLQQTRGVVPRNLRREAVSRGVASERLVFAPKMEKLENHLARYRLADLFLDTLPYNAHTTASDALWAGVPVLTCMGASYAGRVAGSLLHAVDLPELITHCTDDYEAMALRLATTPSLLSGIRRRLAANRNTHALFDTDRFRRSIESAYATMADIARRGESPASFAVEAPEAGRFPRAGGLQPAGSIGWPRDPTMATGAGASDS